MTSLGISDNHFYPRTNDNTQNIVADSIISTDIACTNLTVTNMNIVNNNITDLNVLNSLKVNGELLSDGSRNLQTTSVASGFVSSEGGFFDNLTASQLNFSGLSGASGYIQNMTFSGCTGNTGHINTLITNGITGTTGYINTLTVGRTGYINNITSQAGNNLSINSASNQNIVIDALGAGRILLNTVNSYGVVIGTNALEYDNVLISPLGDTSRNSIVMATLLSPTSEDRPAIFGSRGISYSHLAIGSYAKSTIIGGAPATNHNDSYFTKSCEIIGQTGFCGINIRNAGGLFFDNSQCIDINKNVTCGTITSSQLVSKGITGTTIIARLKDFTTDEKQLQLGYDTTNDRGYVGAIHNGVAYKDMQFYLPGGGNVSIWLNGSLFINGTNAFDSSRNITCQAITSSSIYGNTGSLQDRQMMITSGGVFKSYDNVQYISIHPLLNVSGTAIGNYTAIPQGLRNYCHSFNVLGVVAGWGGVGTIDVRIYTPTGNLVTQVSYNADSSYLTKSTTPNVAMSGLSSTASYLEYTINYTGGASGSFTLISLNIGVY